MDDVLAGNWKQMRGKVKEWWGQLTDDDLDKVNGQKDQLLGLLQKRYGWTKEQAEAEYNKRMMGYKVREPMM